MYPECNANKVCAIHFLGKKLGIHTEICDYFKEVILKLGLFRMVRNSLKLNQNWY